MIICVKYSGKTYCINSDPFSGNKYVLTVSKSKHNWNDDLEINFSTKSSPEYNERLSEEAVINLSKREAISLATAILSYCQQAEKHSDPSPVKVEFNNEDFSSKFESTITIQELAKFLQVDETEIIREAKNLHRYNSLNSGVHISFNDAQKIKEKFSNTGKD